MSYYKEVFRTEYSLQLGIPWVDDTCFLCENIAVKCKIQPLRPHIMCKVNNYQRYAEKNGKNSMEKFEEFGEGRKMRMMLLKSVLIMSNLDLLKIPVQEFNFLSKLTVSVFSIINFKTNENHVYAYDETTVGKSLNEVCSFLSVYLQNLPKSIKHVYLFSDWCPNRNHTITRMLYVLSPNVYNVATLLPSPRSQFSW